MDEQKPGRLKNLLERLPPGAYVDSRWLVAHGVLRSSLAGYARSGWLTRVAHGLYRRPEGLPTSPILPADWRAVVLASQGLMGYPIHVGGMSALREDGHAHHLAFGQCPVHLHAPRFPGWLKKLPTTEPLQFHTTRAFGDSPVGLGAGMPVMPIALPVLPWWKQPLRRSEPERAILEALDELPGQESFTTIDRVFESLVALRPRRVTAALEACMSVKAKRLFFVLAGRHDHAWLKHVDPDRINLGTGDRSLVKGGKLHPIWRITVPAELLTPARETRHGG